jgi:BirA family transcriptional regulator, biotin operon repressor / biotin---[acetyl-CoA-carboxylase] ligase
MSIPAADFPAARARAARLLALDSATSTNDVLAAAAAAQPGDWPHLSVVATLAQTAGRGRLGRTWVAPAGRTLAASVLLRPSGAGGADAVGWVPLAAGAAMAEVVGRRLPAGAVGLKWPNDVLTRADDRKLCGILAELQPDGAIVLGAGVNLTLTAEELPVPTATSLALAGATDVDPDALLAEWLEALAALVDPLLAGDAGPAARAVREACTTLGRRVRIELPGGESLEGEAVDVDETGRLLVRPDAPGSSEYGPLRAVAAGDVTHLRY